MLKTALDIKSDPNGKGVESKITHLQIFSFTEPSVTRLIKYKILFLEASATKRTRKDLMLIHQ
jgi:hypothetical protein